MTERDRYTTALTEAIRMDGSAAWLWVVQSERSTEVHGYAPDEATARRCADAVVAVLQGDACACQGYWHDQAIGEMRAAEQARAELEVLREGVAAAVDGLDAAGCIPHAVSVRALHDRLRAVLDGEGRVLGRGSAEPFRLPPDGPGRCTMARDGKHAFDPARIGGACTICGTPAAVIMQRVLVGAVDPIEQAAKVAAEQERAAVVKWLRERVEIMNGNNDRRTGAVEELLWAIERGEHMETP